MLIPETSLYSQHQEEQVIRSFFEDKRGGTFLDIGCATPKKISTTYFLEKHLGWSGIAVDAAPQKKAAVGQNIGQTLNYLLT